MQWKVLNPAKALRTLRKTPRIPEAILAAAPDERAPVPGNSGDEWDTPAILRHLREYEMVVRQRVDLMLAAENPVLPTTTGAESAHDITPDDLRILLDDWQAQRLEL